MKPAGTQSDKNMNFDGMENMAPSKSSKYMTNHWSGHMNDGRTVNKGRGPTVGNNGLCDTPRNLGASVTRDEYRRPPTSSVPALPKQGTVSDSINRGQQYRGTGGTQVRKPANSDSIRTAQTGGPGYGATTKSKTPNTARGDSNFNYGPKSQY